MIYLCPGAQERPCSGHNPGRAMVLRVRCQPCSPWHLLHCQVPATQDTIWEKQGWGRTKVQWWRGNKVFPESWLSEQGVQLSFILLRSVIWHAENSQAHSSWGPQVRQCPGFLSQNNNYVLLSVCLSTRKKKMHKGLKKSLKLHKGLSKSLGFRTLVGEGAHIL